MNLNVLPEVANVGRPKKMQELEPDGSQHVGSDEGPIYYRKLSPSAQFWQTVKKHEGNEAIVFYIYRLWPKIDRKLSGASSTNIGKLTTISEKILLREYGTGKYQVRMNDTSKGKTGGAVANAVIDVEDPDQPPVLDVNEVVRGAECNAGYLEGLRIRGLLPEQKEGSMANVEAGAAAEAVKTLGALAQQAMSKKDSGSDLANLKDLVEVLKGITPAPVVAPSSDNSKILELLLTQQTMLLSKLMDREPAASAGGDSVESLTKAIKLIGQLKGAGRGGGSSWVSDLLQVLPTIAPAFADSLRSMASLRAAPVPLPSTGLAAVPVAAGAPVLPFSPVPAVSAPGDDMNVMMLRFVAVGKKALSAFQKGTEGCAFAAALCDFEDDGEVVYQALFEMGRDGIMSALQSIPGSEQYAASEPAMRAWINSFISYGEPEPGDGGEGVPE